MPSLPLTLDLVDRETATSFTSRLAARNGLTARDFCSDFGLKFSKVIDGEPQTLAAIAELGGVDATDLADWSPLYHGARDHTFRGHAFRSKTLRQPALRACPLCLKADADSDLPAAQAMAMRGHWLVPHVGVCLVHEHPLITLVQETQPAKRYDTAAQLASKSPAILQGQFDRPTDTTSNFEDWIDSRLKHGPSEDWLSQQPLHAGATFCRLLGIALLRLDGVNLNQIAEDQRHGLYEVGYEVAQHGESAVQKALTKLHALVSTPQDGPRKVYTALYDRLAHDYASDPDYAVFRDLLRRHMSQTWPLGPGDELLGEPVRERRLHSVATAAIATGVDPGRLRKLLIAERILDESASSLADGWVVFDANAAAGKLEDLTTLVPANKFRDLIGASRSQFDLLVADGVLSPATVTPDTKAVWDPREGEAFLNRLLSGAIQLRQSQHSWEHIARSAQRLKIGPGVVVDAILSGRLRRVGNLEGRTGYAAVYVDHDEVSRLFGATAAPGYSIAVFAKMIGLRQPSNLSRLIKDGHTPATVLTNPKTKARQAYVTNEDAEAFHARFYTLRSLSQRYGRSWQNLGAELDRRGVEPFNEDGQTYGRLFLREEVDSALSKI